MQIDVFRTYFLYGLPIYSQILDNDLKNNADDSELGIRDLAINQKFIDRFKPFHAERYCLPMDEHGEQQPDYSEPQPQHIIPGFYTHHYRNHHCPHYLNVEGREITIPASALNQYDFFSVTPVPQDIILKWDFVLALESIPIIYVVLEAEYPIDSELAYRLSSLHIAPKIKFIPTNSFNHLIDPNLRKNFSDYLNIAELVKIIQRHYYLKVGLSEELAETELEAIAHLPFTAIEVSDSYKTQEEFIKSHRSELVDLISKPASYEFEQGSHVHIKTVLGDDRVWSVADDTLFVGAYSGGLYVRLTNLDEGIEHSTSDYRLTEETSVFHTFRLAVSNYYLLRMVDEEFDEAIAQLKDDIQERRRQLQALYSRTTENLNAGARDSKEDGRILQELNNTVLQVRELRFKFVELLEELDNADKLIDEEWHIELLNKINTSLGSYGWRDSIRTRIENLEQLVGMLETSYKRFLDYNEAVETRERELQINAVAILFSAFAVAEFLGLLFDVALDNENPFFHWAHNWITYPIASLMGKNIQPITESLIASVPENMKAYMTISHWIASGLLVGIIIAITILFGVTGRMYIKRRKRGNLRV